jgi:hypothetical protein
MDLVRGGAALITDAPEDFADSIVRLCTDPALHAGLSRNSVEHARARWDPSAVAPRLLETMAGLPWHCLRLQRTRVALPLAGDRKGLARRS